ncbi:MAG: cytochrome b/b6 domain-containing protein [Gammaproteobacteria bacterium]|nr:cytochrome b/b6 domain-containing protein [Gammaproteobacteria bacterium]
MLTHERSQYLRQSQSGRGKSRLALAAAILCFSISSTPAQDNEKCFDCHSDADLTGSRGGEAMSVFVAADSYAASVHGDMACVDCHQDIDPDRRRHSTRKDLELVDCSGCHKPEAARHKRSLHGVAATRGDPMAPVCADCHGKHDILSASDHDSPTAVMNVPVLCGSCHREGSPVSRTHEISQENILEHYSMSIHGEGLFRQGLTVTAVCTSCHTSHDIRPHTDPRSTIHADNVAATCATCHGQIEQVHRKVIEGQLWTEDPGKIPTCVDCHAPHEIRNVFYPDGLADKDCLTCHSDPELTMIRGGRTVSLFIDEQTYENSAHADTACAQCHTDVTVSKERACETVQSTVDCSICHAEQVTEYEGSTHGTLHADNDPDAPSCQDCHARHATLDKELPSSPTYPRNVPALCGTCHRIGEQAATRIDAEVDDIVGSYEDSVHGRALTDSGLIVAATCADCHGAHSELPPDDPQALINPKNIAGTCGVCHHGIEEEFRTSIHWTDDPDSDKEYPTCEDCHASHTISRIDKPGFRTRMMDQCGRCHVEQTETFFDTFHGKVSRLGGEGAAKCYDCHGTHGILPPTEPDSMLSRDNVVETCGQCHEGSHRQFAGYLTHATHHDRDRYPWLFWSFWSMTALLVGTLTFALMHTLAWVVRLLLNRDEWKAHKARARDKSQVFYRRFSRLQRTLHIVMMLSFFTLALTGMALKFSYMSWAQVTSRLLGGFDSMGFLHRIGAVVLITVFIVHLRDVTRRKKTSGQTWLQIITGPDSIIFNGRDLKEFIQSIKWFFGMGSRPNYGRYTYWEKFDYFAVAWGVAIIGSTGLVLWLPELFTYIVPGWAVNVATIIHSDEALLAVGFIFTIHFFNTHFRPDKFPMDPVIFTGRVSLEELKFDKPGEYAALVESGELEDHLVKAFPDSKERGVRIFAYLALAFGLVLLSLIVYTMLFGYR